LSIINRGQPTTVEKFGPEVPYQWLLLVENSTQYQFGKSISPVDNYTKPAHFDYGVRKFWTRWISPLRQKICRN